MRRNGIAAMFAGAVVVALATPATASTPFAVIGHRGMESDATVTENSRAAIASALRLGADGVEVDVRRTEDGKIVVMHDSTLDRTTNCTGAIEQAAYDAVRACSLVTGEKVPNLFEMAWEFSKHDAGTDTLWIHVKFEPTAGMRKKIFKAVDKYGLRDQTVILADEDDALDAFKRWSGIRRALIFNQADVDQGGQESWSAGYDYAVPYRVLVTPELVAQARETGSKVYGVEDHWVTLEQAKAMRLDGLVANDVAEAL